MSQFSPPPTPIPPPPHSPPTVPGQIAGAQQPTRWPLVIGTIAIVLGVLSALCHAFGIIGPIVQRYVSTAMPPDQQRLLEIQLRWAAWLMTNEAVAAILAILCLVGGIGLTQRADWGRRIMRVWAWVSLLHAIGACILQYQIMSETASTVATFQSTAASMPAGMMTAMKGGIAIGVCMWFIWLCAFPIFILIWFHRPAIREEMRSWAGSVPVQRGAL